MSSAWLRFDALARMPRSRFNHSPGMDIEAPRRRGDAKERILQLAEAAVLEKGFAGTSIDELIAAAGITKSGFFYHFKDKTELARALLARYIAHEDQLFDELFARADALNEDPCTDSSSG